MAFNAAEVNVECERTMTTSLLDLNDFSLLHVFSYLNLMDSINFAETSKRLKSVSGLHFVKNKRLDLLQYELCEQPNKPSAETILSHIGQHIENLTIDSIRSTVEKAIVDNCVNVTTLKLYDCNGTSELTNWMQQLNLESLTIEHCIHFNEMSVGLATLKNLQIKSLGLSATELTNILVKTTELETLEVLLYYPDFNYDIFTKLPKLQCVDIEICSGDLVDLAEFLKMDVLTRFKISLPYNSGAGELRRLNSFLEILAERSKLNELQLYTESVNQNTFRILESFHVTSIGFCADDYVDHIGDERWMTHQLVAAQPNVKNLDFMDTDLPIEAVAFVVKNLVKLETFTFDMPTEDLEQLDELRIDEMLKTSTSRPMLTLNINSGYSDGVKIELRFEQRNHRIVELPPNCADDSYFL